MTSGPARTVFVGSGGFGRASLLGLAAHEDAELVGVVTAPPRPAGRRLRSTRTPIHDTAIELDIPSVLTPTRLRDKDAIASVLGLRPELIVLVDYGRLVPAELLHLPHGALNLHPSLLPRHRGATPIPATILAGDTETGVSLIQMDAGIDSGPIVAQARAPLDGSETTPELEERLAPIAAALLADRLGPWIRGQIVATPQGEEGVTLTRPLRREDGRLDVTRSAAELGRQVRAFQPWPGSYVETAEGRLVVWRAGVGDERTAAPGLIDPAGVGTAAGRLLLDEVQQGGGRRMSWSDFVRGHPGIVGSSIVT